MHNTLTRLQNGFGYFTTCAFFLASLIAFISIIPIPAPTSSPSATVSVQSIQVVKGRPHYYSPKKEEFAHIRFNLDADLSGLFTWNTKQVFVYVMASYPPSKINNVGGGTEMSEAIIWDTIISAPATPFSWQNLMSRYWSSEAPKKSSKSKKSSASSKSKTTPITKDIVKPGVLFLENQKPKYQITDASGILSERANATLVVGWNVQPWVGALVWDKGFLGKRVGAWQAGRVGRSETFNFPPLKGTRTDVIKDREGPRTPAAAEASGVV